MSSEHLYELSSIRPQSHEIKWIQVQSKSSIKRIRRNKQAAWAGSSSPEDIYNCCSSTEPSAHTMAIWGKHLWPIDKRGETQSLVYTCTGLVCECKLEMKDVYITAWLRGGLNSNGKGKSFQWEELKAMHAASLFMCKGKCPKVKMCMDSWAVVNV